MVALCRRDRREDGAVLVLMLMTVVAILALMFMTTQILVARVDGMRGLYLSFQSAQHGYTNPLYGQDALNSVYWTLYLSGVGNLSNLTYGPNAPTTESVDLDGDGNDDTSLTVEFARSAGSPAQVSVTLDRTSDLLSGLFGFLTDVNLKTKGRAYGGGTFVNLSVDMTPALYRRRKYVDLAASFGVTLDGSDVSTEEIRFRSQIVKGCLDTIPEDYCMSLIRPIR